MISDQEPGPVVVGVTADGDNTGALVFAAGEARRLRVQVRLVHAAHEVMPPSSQSVLVGYQDLDEVFEVVLSGARHVFAQVAPDVMLETVARLGRPVDVLVAQSEQASMLVLEHRAMSRLGRIFTGSTSAGVALRAHCPVVSVPTGWSPERRGRVTVGVDEHGGPAHVLEAAFSEAAARGASLTVVHAWRLDRPYAGLVTAGDDRPEWLAAARQHLQEAVAPWQARSPGVPVEIEVRHAWSAEALVDASTTSDLLVLGRHGSRAPRFALGSLARTLIAHSQCPVAVVPEPEDREHLAAYELAPAT